MVGMVLVAVALALQIHVVVEVVCGLLLVPGEGGEQVLLHASPFISTAFQLKRHFPSKVGNFFISPQIANPQILLLIPQSQILKFLRCASPQICND
jgi:hypothetical protein